MSVEATESLGETSGDDFQYIDNINPEIIWNGRSINKEDYIEKNLKETIFTIYKEQHLQPGVTTCSFLDGYFDSDAKKAQEFEIDVLLHAIHCSSLEEENKKLRELITLTDNFVLSAGLIGIAVFSRDYRTAFSIATGLYFLVKEKTFLTFEQLKKLLNERDKDYEDLFFYTRWEDYEKNQQELRSRGLILDSYNSHYTGNPHYTENPHYQKPLA